MSLKTQVLEDLEILEEPQLEKVAEYGAFLRFSARRHRPQPDESEWAALYAEFAEEDRALAEAGMADYAAALAREDVA
jgi:hypothetical protein